MPVSIETLSLTHGPRAAAFEEAARIAEGTLPVDVTMTESEREAFRLGVGMAAANIRALAVGDDEP